MTFFAALSTLLQWKFFGLHEKGVFMAMGDFVKMWAVLLCVLAVLMEMGKQRRGAGAGGGDTHGKG